MELSKLLAVLAREFEARGIDCALIGGYALGAYGVSRATIDLDFLVAAANLPALDGVMKELGYDKAFSSENVSQYVAKLQGLPEVDFLHAFRPAALAMLRRARPMPGLPPGEHIKVLAPEDIIGLKVQAIANNPERARKDGADIEDMLRAVKADWAALKVYFDLFGMDAYYSELRAKYEK